MNTIKQIFDIENGLKLPLTENNLYYKVKIINGTYVIYLSQNPNLNEVKSYANTDIKPVLNDTDLSNELFGNDFKIIVGMVCSLNEFSILFLIDSNYIQFKLSNENQFKYYNLLLEPKFLTKSLIGCEGNTFENGIPLDPITMEPIPEEERFILGNSCYFKETIKLIINSDKPLDPLTRKPISREIINMFISNKLNNDTIRIAVQLWLTNEEEALKKYGHISDWDVSNVTNMLSLFNGAKNFNQPLNNWNVSNVTDMSYMFFEAINFNQPLNNWNVSNVTNMLLMFNDAINFNQPLNNWNVSKVTDMSGMFMVLKILINHWIIGMYLTLLICQTCFLKLYHLIKNHHGIKINNLTPEKSYFKLILYNSYHDQ